MYMTISSSFRLFVIHINLKYKQIITVCMDKVSRAGFRRGQSGQLPRGPHHWRRKHKYLGGGTGVVFARAPGLRKYKVARATPKKG